MKIKTWMLAVMLAVTATARAATNDLTGLLQQGLFEEEANRNLDAAIVNYQSLASAFDKDRQLAATAIFRLGECYRKLGKTNEAVLQYQRIVKEFGDQPTLVTLSRQNLAGLDHVEQSATGQQSSPASEQARELELVKKLQTMPLKEILQVAPTVLTDATLINLVYQYNQTELDLVRLLTDHAEEHADVQKEKAIQKALNEKIMERLQGLSRALSLELSTAANPQEKSAFGGGLNAADESVTTDDEQIQIRNIQAMIQNSPDLINAAGAGVNGDRTPLLAAAEKGQLVVAKYLLDHGADVNRSIRGTPLFLAADNGHRAMVELLLARGADVNSFNPLYRAVSKGFTGVAQVLLANNADVNLPGDNGQRPLHAAVTSGQTELIQMLLSHGADVNATDSGSNAPLHLAARQNKLDAAKILLAAKADVEARNSEGNTPLHEAARSGSDKIVSLLLDSGASVEATNHNNTTPLLFAVLNNRVEATHVLLTHKADPNNRKANSSGSFSYPVEFACGPKDTEILKLLLDAGAKPETGPDDPFRPLFIAIANNAVDAVQLLLQHGANPNNPCRNNPLPPLHTVLNDGRDKRMVPLLLDNGADPNAKDRDGLTPLLRTTDPEIGRLLIEHKADLNARDKNGNTPLLRAANLSATNFLAFLVEAGAKTDLQETNGNTALHYAAYNGGSESVAILLEHKADPNVQNSQGFTPLDIAKAGQSGWMPESMLTPKPAMMNHPTSAENQAKIADLLIQAGGLANLPKRDRIEVGRASNSVRTISKDSSGRNRYSLLETISTTYGLLSQNSSGEWRPDHGSKQGLLGGLRFPDFKRVVIYRRMDNSLKQTAINIDVDEILKTGDCSRDVWLEWGDIVEIPEVDHPVDEKWDGLPQKAAAALSKCVAREVTIKIKGESTTLKLAPELAVSDLGTDAERWSLARAAFMLRSVLDNSKLLRVSSDLSRVKVTRQDPITKKTMEWTIDCTEPRQADLWLRDGDVIEVPEK